MPSPPIAIGGIGGSGTRLIAAMLRELGFYIGDDLNSALDNLWFTLLFKRAELWPPEAHRGTLGHAVRVFVNAMRYRQPLVAADLELIAACKRQPRPQHPVAWLEARAESLLRVAGKAAETTPRWGWKEPNTHLVLPALMREITGLKYIHVMRHGLDMAGSANQKQLALWGPLLLGEAVDPGHPAHALRFWCAVHRRILAIGATLPGRFLLLNFDALCRDPARQLPKLLSFLGVGTGGAAPAGLARKIVPPESMGRGRQYDQSMFAPEDLAFVRQLGFSLD